MFIACAVNLDGKAFVGNSLDVEDPFEACVGLLG